MDPEADMPEPRKGNSCGKFDEKAEETDKGLRIRERIQYPGRHGRSPCHGSDQATLADTIHGGGGCGLPATEELPNWHKKH